MDSFERQGKLLKSVRLKHDLSQGQLAKIIGLTSPQFISNIERGKCGISATIAKVLVSKLKVDKEKLVKAYRQDIGDNYERAI